MFRQQVHGVSTINAIKMLKDEGAIYLYRGILPPLLQKSTSTCIMFGTYSHYNRLMSDFLGIKNVSCGFFSNTVNFFFVKILIYISFFYILTWLQTLQMPKIPMLSFNVFPLRYFHDMMGKQQIALVFLDNRNIASSSSSWCCMVLWIYKELWKMMFRRMESRARKEEYVETCH